MFLSFQVRSLRRAALWVVLATTAIGPTWAPAADEAEEEDPLDRTGKNIKLRKMEDVDLSSEYQIIAEQKRMESIDRLKSLLERGGVPDETKAEMMLRLADLYFEQGRYLYLREMAAYDEQYEACFNQPGCKTELLAPNNGGSREWQEKSIRLYEGILSQYPRYARADQATFFLGSALKDVGREADSVQAFKKLVKLYPESKYLPDAYVLIGEYYFDVENNAFGALKAYLKATTYPESPKYSYALYKLGWCYYNVGEYDKAIETMKAVVNHSMANQQTQSSLQLQDEALKDLVRFFADADKMNEAIEYFTSLGRSDLIRTTLKRLAAMFYEQGKFDRSIEMYRRLILDAPTSKDNPEYQAEIISAYKKMGQREKVLEEINRLRTDYGSNSAWARANAADPQAIAEAQSKIEGQLRGIAVDYHNTARQYEKSRHPDAPKVYELARQAYATYLDLFPSNEHTYDVRYAYGELLYKLKDYEGAYTQYMAVVALDPNGKHSKFCAESAVFAAEEQIKREGGADGSGKVIARATDVTEPQPLTLWEQRFVDACNQYATLYQGDKRVKDMIYKSAYLLYNKYRFDDAAKQFQVVIAMDPTSKEAELAANLILDALVVRKQYDTLRSTSKAFYDQPGLGTAQFKKDVYEIYQNSSFKLIELNFEKDKDFKKAADAFVAFYEEFPESPLSAQALNNASAYYNKSGAIASSVKVRHILAEDPKFGPKTKYYYDQIGFLGYDYELIAEYEKAAFYYERLWALFPEEKKKPENASKIAEMETRAGDAIYSAAVFRKGVGQWEQAIANYNQFVTAFPNDKRVAETKIAIGKIYEENQRWEEAANVYQAYFKNPPKDGPLEYTYFARLHYGQAMEKLGKIKERDAIYKETIALYTKSGATSTKGPHTEFVAEMMYQIAQPMLTEYFTLKVKGLGKGAAQKAEDKALTDSLLKKTKALADVEKTYTEVVNLGAGEWGIAALVALGKVYEDMAISLRTGDAPAYLTAEQVELYRMQIEDKAYVQDEKAVNAYKTALDKSFELTLYNENTAYATRQLGVLRPDEYPGLSEVLLDPRWTSSKTSKQYPYETSL